MKRVPTPTIDDAQVFDNIVSAKRPARQVVLKNIRSQVVAAYDDYRATAPTFQNLTDVALSPKQRETLLHTYSSETAPLTLLRGELMKPLVVARCPFCGVGEASTLDHYLPKVKKPEFSTFSSNLVPSCVPCNQRKSDQVLVTGTSIRSFLHPYYDDIPTNQFILLKVDLQANSIALTYRITRPSGISTSLFKQLKSHFEQLNLADRYRVMSLTHLRDLRRALADLYGVDKNTQRVASQLQRTAGHWEADYGLNYWMSVLYRTLANDNAFCDGGFTVLDKIQ